MNISGILIQTRPQLRDEVIQAVDKFPWLDVHFSDDAGRIIVTIEGETVEVEHERASRLLQVPNVLSVDMLNHYFSEEEIPDEKTVDSSPVGG